MNTKRLLLRTTGAASAFAILGSARTAQASPRGPRADYFPNAVVHDQDGTRLRFYDDIVRGRRVAFNMMYTACSNICPANTANLREVQKLLAGRLGKDVHMVSLTLQPEFDRPRDLKDYMKRYAIGPGWTFLTGSPSDIDTIRRKLGFYSLDPEVDADVNQHTGMVRIGNEPLDRWAMVPALGSPKQIVRSILEA